MERPHIQPDPSQFVASLDPDAIRRRLDELSREQSALRVLLRAALARRPRGQTKPTGQEAQL
jgi:hypothetical protein